MRHRSSIRAAATVIGVAAVLVPVAASAHPASTARPAAPTGMKVVAATAHGFTVTAARAAHAKAYRLYTSTVRSNLFTANIHNAAHSPWRSKPALTISGLNFVLTPYYYRLEAINGQRTKFSATIGEVGLKPAKPTNLAATASHTRTFLTWSGSSATGYQIERATDLLMTSHTKLVTVKGSMPQYTPYGLKGGSTHYFRVRALNDATPSAWSSKVQVTSLVNTFDVRTMTYNVMEADRVGQIENGSSIQPWSVRKPAVVRTITKAHPDVIGIQEAAAFTGPHYQRQIDSLHAALPGYGLAFTEVLPGTPGWHRTGNYILFNKATFSRVGDGGHWALGDMRWAAWQVLKNKATGGKFLFVNAHELPTAGGAADTKRRHETQALLADARSQAQAAGGVPIVYVGDFNSDQYRHHVVNAPTEVMTNQGIADAFNTAQKFVRPTYNTANGYQRRPPHDGAHIDEVFAPAGVGVRTWKLQLRLSHGAFIGPIPSDHNALVSDLTVPYS